MSVHAYRGTNDKVAGINPALCDLGQDTYLTSLSLLLLLYETENLNQALALGCCCLFGGFICLFLR